MSLSIDLHPDIIRIHSPHPPISDSTTHIAEDAIQCPQLTNRVYDFMKSWLREIAFTVTTGILIAKETLLGTPAEYVVPHAKNNHWKAKNKGLYIAIHGVYGRPCNWHTQLSTLRKLEPDFEIRVPYVPKQGDCSLEKAVAPIEAMARDYIRKCSKNPICLMGFSNGARIAVELEVRLRDTKTPIKVSCIAGVLSGTKQMDLINALGLAKKVFHASLVEELLYQSPTAVQLMKRMREPLPNDIERSYDFYGSPTDFQIKPYAGSFPFLDNKKVRYYLVSGENHNSMISKVAAIQVEHCSKWMKKTCIPPS